MNRTLAVLLFSSAVMVSGQAAMADSLDARQAIDLLAGKTWYGVNSAGKKFYFYHESDGSFRAKFIPGYGKKENFSGKWFEKWGEICLDWGRKKSCFFRFEAEGHVLALIRSDLVVQTGTIVDGNPAGL